MRLALSILIIVSLPCVAMAGKRKKEPAITGKDWKGPYIEHRLSSRFAAFLKRYERLTAEHAEIMEIKNEKKRKNKEDRWKSAMDDLTNDLADKIEREAGSYKRELKTLEKQLQKLDKQRDRGGNEKVMERLEAEEAVAMKRKKELEGVVKAVTDLQGCFSDNHKKRSGTAFELMGMMPPPIKGKTIDGEDFDLASADGQYKAIVFFSEKNRDSLLTLRNVGRMDGRKLEGKSVKVIYVNVDRDKEDAEQHKAALKGLIAKGTVIVDKTNDISASYRVGLLPHTVLVDSDGLIQLIVVGPQAKRLIDEKAKLLKKSSVK